MEHPYVPRDLQLPGYVPVSLSQSTILTVFGLSSLFVVSLVWLLSGRWRNLSNLDRLLMCWWAFTGLTHMILEGYFAFSPEFYKEKTGFYLAEVWKEYSKGDSRYAGRDTAIVTVEGITSVLEGPPSLLAVYAIATGKGYSYILQFAISLGQLYGTLVYFIAAYLDGDNFAASPFYYYAYYILANSFWILIPSLIAVRCWKKISMAVQSQSQKKNKVR
ncbi:probable 3-beta-hydroxysteroid-Delta(8),Delta(7)-isomerase [Durio zibethinus]|uniref:Probable 3-beta-hydroxysteroid-Delta(8),Delta(7)-isomerase n=1 Tax=Durio zibethinus TaxID=66656 RepID=A0A6P5ZHY2_DURZI|nr:probable 3-beta-hydroxysteroid-Delta(8),Delta(7)-isomerase [Durio zibethinus]